VKLDFNRLTSADKRAFKPITRGISSPTIPSNSYKTAAFEIRSTRFELVLFRIKSQTSIATCKQEEKKEVKLQKILYSVFNYMGESYNEDMRLITFIEMKELAEDRIKRAQLKQDSGKN